jgi:SNF family Na+-dependent transporter
MNAYGSYNRTREPVILNAFLIGIIDFLFSFIAGFGVWGGIGYLQAKSNISYA